MKKIDGYWVEGTNKWNCDFYTRKEAMELAKTLIDCSDCINCSFCRDCRFCSFCRNCRFCSNCRNCRFCSDCLDCRSCRSCINCSDYQTNPNRISSKLIGSRTSQTTIYILNDNIQVVCGCYKGNLLEFEQRINKVYPTGKHHDNYMDFIKFTKSYIEYLGRPK